MTLSSKDIKHIASLARLELTEKEVKQYRAELAGIVRYVDQLHTVKLKKGSKSSSANSTYHGRSDDVRPWPTAEREAALQQVPSKQGRLVKVKRILG